MESLFAAYNHVATPLMVLDSSGTLLYANPLCRKRFCIEDDAAFPINGEGKEAFTAQMMTCHGQQVTTSWVYCVTDVGVVCTFTHLEEGQLTLTFYETLIRSMGEGVVMHDSEGAIVLANESAQRILGLSAEQLRGRTSVDPAWHTIREDGSPFPGEEHPAMVALATGEPQHNVIMGVHKPDGELTWISVNAEPVALDRGAVLVSFTDITPLKEMQLAVERSQSRYRAMFEEHSAIMLLIDPQSGRIVDANAAASRFYGYSRDDLLSKRIQDINTLTPEQLETRMRSAVAQDTNHFHFIHRLATGETRHVEVYSVALDVEGETLLYSIVHDVTARFLAEKALRLSEERFRRVAESAQDAIITTSVQGTILYWNKAARRMFGYTETEAIGSHINLLVPPDYKHTHRERFAAYAARPRNRYASHVIEVEGLHKSGRVFPIEVSLSGWDIDGVHYLTAIIRDVTSRRLAEQQRIELAVEREKSAVLTSFIHDASHEFRSPLSVITTNVFLLDRITDEAKRTAKKEQIREAVRELSHLLEGIIKLVELEHLTLTGLKDANLNSIMQSVVVDLERMAGQKGHSLALTLPEEGAIIEGHTGKLFHAMYHLVHNALHFTPQGGSISVEVEPTAHDVTIRVTDDGPGMSAETQAHMFERFWRYDKAHTTAGFGLGLPIAQRVIELHNGHITYESKLGDGTTCTVKLPRSQPS